ncbi:MAG: LacI family DNA-binding transcriptional regulator [Lachnospiraceae bacterium]|nr:LacI family DNA-binding transcriptional regulator [Lachnospiraceae bacterium]MDD3616669.1 LacI family DNA-binding transcriptional regulator [Lachnospiraceae bacterium]
MATVKEVAEMAGVSVGTVSKVLNGIQVGEKNKEKVEQAIRVLGYEINVYARGLRAQNTYTAAVIVPNLYNQFFALFVEYVEKAFSSRGYKLMLCISSGDAKKEVDYITLSRQNKVDGIIGITYNDIEQYVTEGMPFVSLDRHFIQQVHCVTCDNYGGGWMAGTVFAKAHCKSLLYVRTGSDLSGETMKRGRGFEDYCKSKQIRFEVLDMHDIDDQNGLDDHNRIYACFDTFFKDKIVNGKCIFDGIFTSGDYLALMLKEYLEKQEIVVPQDVQIIGFDGLQLYKDGPYMVSSIAQPIPKLAEKCVDNLLGLIQKEEVEMLSMLPVTFVEGGTTKAVY